MPENHSSIDSPTANIIELVKARKTLKVLGDPASPTLISKDSKTRNHPLVMNAIETAGWAPFHYHRAVDGIAEPWRAHVIWSDDCRIIASSFHEWFPDVKPTNKLPPMLSACGALVLVNWIPQFNNPNSINAGIPKEKQVSIDEEHLAATAAMVQNLLLILTAYGMGTYWSSGGQLGSQIMFEKLGIDSSEKLIAAVFVEFPENISEEKDRLEGKHRNSRTNKWIREVAL